MKLDMWDTTTVTPGITATDGNACAAGTCKSIHAIVAFIVTGITEPGAAGNAFRLSRAIRHSGWMERRFPIPPALSRVSSSSIDMT